MAYTQMEGLSLNALFRRRSSYGKVQHGPQRDLKVVMWKIEILIANSKGRFEEGQTLNTSPVDKGECWV